jgi:hypothetical protein
MADSERRQNLVTKLCIFFLKKRQLEIFLKGWQSEAPGQDLSTTLT